MKKFLFISIILSFSFNLSGQNELVKLYIKCDRCDNNYLKKEINYLDHVREQGLADIQLFIYRNRNSNNGNRYTLDYIGANKFSNNKISLTLDTNPKMTRDEIRNSLKRKIELGLVHYLMKTEIANNISIEIDSLINNNNSDESSSDKWKNWVFQS